MTSSSSLYGSVTQQNSSSSNSTSLYGGADTPIPDSSGNVVVRGDLYVLSGNILTTATTGNIFPANATTINLGLAATAVNIGAGSGTTTINNNLVVDGSVTADGADFGNITIGVADDNTITTTSGDLKLTSATDNINLSPGLTFTYSEANDRLNRPAVQSTSGNSSGFRVLAPNATTSASATLSTFSTNDVDNGKFLNLNARGNATTPLRIQTGEYTSGVLGASGDSLVFVDGGNAYHASINPAGPTNPLDLTTKAYVDAIPSVSYTIDASSTTGGANFNLVGSDASTDTVKFAQGTGISVTRTDANTITITNTAPDTTVTYTQNISSTTGGANLNLVGSDSTTDTVKFANGTGVTVAYTDASTATISIGQAVATTDDVIFNSVNTPTVFGTGNLTLQGGSVTPSEIEIGDEIVASLTGGIGGDTATLTANAGSLTWDHVKGAMVIGSVDGTWSLNADGTTSFPNYTFPYADGTSNQVLRTNGSGVLSWYSPSDLNTTYTVDATSTTGGANLNLVGSDSTTDSVAYLGSGATTVTRTDANTITISSTDTNTTYDFAASSTTGGANLNLTGSDATTDTVKLTNGGHITATYTSATEVTLGSDATDANTVSTIVARDTSGNFSAGTISMTKGLAGSTASITDYPNAQFIASQANGGDTHNYNIGVAAEAVADSGDSTIWGVGVYGSGKTNGGTRSAGVLGDGSVTNSADTGSAVGVRGYATDTHTGGFNIGVLGDAAGSSTGNYAFYVTAGDIAAAGALTITTLGSNGNITLAPNGTGKVVSGVTTMLDASRVKGAIEATRNDSFTLPPSILTSVSGNNGIDIFSNSDATNNGYGAQCSLTTYQGDTAAGSASSASFQLRGALGTNDSPSTSASGDVMGTINYSGYATTGFTNYVASANQGGGLTAYHPLQIQATNTETPTETAFTLANAVQGGNYILRQVITIGSVASSGSGVFTNTSADVRRNDVVRVTGTLTGTMTFPGYADGNLYYVTAGANPTTTFTLSATPGGAPVATTSGTTTGLTFTRYRVQFNYATQTAAPFSVNSKVTIAGSTSGKFDGTGYAVFSNTTGTAMGMYIPAAGNQAGAAGTIGLTNVTGAAALRVRGFVTGQPINNANRVTFIEHSSATGNYRSDAFTFQQGSTTTNHLVLDTTKATFTKPVVFPSYTAAAAGAVTGAVGWQISISDSPTSGGRMAFWDTTNSRWSYISDNSAV